MLDNLSFVPFDPDHLQDLSLSSEINLLKPLLDNPGYAETLKQTGFAETGIYDGNVIGCCGVMAQWKGRSIAWALIGEMPRRCWPDVTRHAIAGLERAHADGARRIEVYVRLGFKQGELWVRRLGFEPVAPKPLWGPDGATFWEYVRYGI